MPRRKTPGTANSRSSIINHQSSIGNLPVALTIAGSDSGGGAGIQADLQTFAALNVFGTCAITCLTAQNPNEVSRVDPVRPGMVREQVRTVCAGFPVAAVKTGMLYSSGIIAAVAEALASEAIPRVVVDPVMAATSGARLLQEDAIVALCGQVLPLASVITPNLPEAGILLGHEIEPSADGLSSAAREIGTRYGASCVVKGGHLPGRRLVDALYTPEGEHVFEGEMLPVHETHGTGCTFSAALAAGLARGEDLPAATRMAQQFVRGALERSAPAGRHYPLRWSNSDAP